MTLGGRFGLSEQRTIVIAGGTGFIGRRLSAELGSRGHRIVILSRQTPRAPVGPVSFVRWTPGVVDNWADALEGAAAVVNL